MPHKYVKADTLTALRQDLKVFESSINRIRAISSGSLEDLKEQVKDLSKTACEKKDNALDLLEIDGKGNMFPPHMQEKIAWLNRGQEKAFNIVLDMIENPQGSIKFYEELKNQTIKDIETLESYEVRQSN